MFFEAYPNCGCSQKRPRRWCKWPLCRRALSWLFCSHGGRGALWWGFDTSSAPGCVGMPGRGLERWFFIWPWCHLAALWGTKHEEDRANPNRHIFEMQQGFGSNSPETWSIHLFTVIGVLLRMASSAFDLMSAGSTWAGSSRSADKTSVENICIPRLPVLQS